MNQGGSNPRGPPQSFKTNVNRSKTKRWVEAKSYSYDGDDWGDADDYDEYGGFDEPAPAKPTGLRQAGQSQTSPAPESNSMGRMDHQSGQQPYTNLPRPQAPYNNPERERANSFGRGDERRAFSGPGPNVVAPMRTAYGQAPGPQNDSTGRQPYGANPPNSVASNAPGMQPPYQQPGQPRRPSFDGPSRAAPGPGFGSTPSPGPGPGPVASNMRGIPRPSGDGSRTQSMTSNISMDPHRREFSNPSAIPQPLQTNRPPRKSSLSQQDEPQNFGVSNTVISPVSANAGPEPEQFPNQARERSASGSTINFVRPADIYRRMQEEKERERQSQESARPSLDGIMGAHRDESPSKSGDDGDATRKRKPALESVAERKSEYGLDGLLSAENVKQKPPSRGPNGSPVLPEISGFESGFGEGFGTSFMDNSPQANNAKSSSVAPKEALALTQDKPKSVVDPVVDTTRAAPPTSQQSDVLSPTSATLSPVNESDLQHQQSVGFRSAVHTAFDQPVRHSPSSASGSVGRSNSESTSVISPIISRAPSSANPTVEEPRISTITEEPSDSRPMSSESIPTPKGGSSDSRRASSHSIPAPFIPGHRRDMSTPSPDNSPARTPNLEVNRQLRNPQEVEIATATPTSANHSSSFASHWAPNDTTESTAPGVANEVRTPNSGSAVVASQQSPVTTSIPAGRESPSKGRVRDLADKYDAGSRRGSDSSSKSATKGFDVVQGSRPASDRLESFRPNLPGSWTSYTTNAPAPKTPEPPKSEPKAEPEQKPESKSESTVAEQLPDPFAAAAAAGSALAGAFLSATGGGQTPEPDEKRESPKQDTVIHPEAQRSLMPRTESASSIVPTPLEMKTDHPGQIEEGEEFFPPIEPLKQRTPTGSTGNLNEAVQSQQIRPSTDLSTESSPSDQESDRLRKEIVRELSPQVESFGESTSNRNRPTEEQSNTQPHDSMLLPSEYDSYWNGSTDGDAVSRGPSHHQVNVRSDSRNVQTPEQPQPSTGASPERPQPSTGASPERPQPSTTTPSFTVSSAPDVPTSKESEFGQTQSDSAKSLGVEQPGLVNRFSWEPLPEEIRPSAPNTAEKSAFTPTPQDSGEQGQSSIPPKQEPNTNKELPRDPETIQNVDSSSLLQQDREKQQMALGSYQPNDGDVTPTAIPPVSEQTKIPAFREILALQSPSERIQKFNATREQFANMNTGLAHWVLTTTNELPEHSDLIQNGGSFVFRTPLTRASAEGRNPNTITSSTPTPTSTPGKPGYSPASSKQSSKGKDLLHSAGIFGGKANSKAKGFFAKGKSRFKGGGSEKVDY